MSPAERVAIREAIAKLEQALDEAERAEPMPEGSPLAEALAGACEHPEGRVGPCQ